MRPLLPLFLGAHCPFVAMQVLSNAMHSSGVQLLTSNRETHPLAQLLICPQRFGPKFYKTTAENMQYLMLLPSSTGRIFAGSSRGLSWHQEALGGAVQGHGDATGTARGSLPQRSPLGRQGLGSLQHRSVVDNWELKVIEIFVGTEQLKCLMSQRRHCTCSPDATGLFIRCLRWGTPPESRGTPMAAASSLGFANMA